MTEEKKEAGEYHSKDFPWEQLQQEVENDPSLHYHLMPFSIPPNPISPPEEEEEEADAWRKFHRRHSTGKFFKERRYLLKEFPELVSCHDSPKVLEVGCGNGSTVLPILRAKQSIAVYACDCSAEILETANEIATEKIGTIKHRFHPFVLDFSINVFPDWLFCSTCQKMQLTKRDVFSPGANLKIMTSELSTLRESQCCIGGVDFVTLIFTLSAVPFQKMPFVIKECFSVLKPGCLLLFRDYVGTGLLLCNVSESPEWEEDATGLGSWKISKAHGMTNVIEVIG